MARSNKVADGLLTSAHDTAVHDGLRLAVPQYLQAADALVSENRKDEARAVLAELLAAKEKRRGFFLLKREQSALGDQRSAVGVKYAKLTWGTQPTEESLDLLNQLSIEFPDEIDIRQANGEALGGAGYFLDALDELTYCSSRRPDDTALRLAIAGLQGKLGRAADAAAVYEALPPAAVVSNKAGLESVVALAEQSNVEDAAARAVLASRLRGAVEKLPANDALRASLTKRINAIEGEQQKTAAQTAAPSAAATESKAPQPAQPPQAAPAPQPASSPASQPAAAAQAVPAPQPAPGPQPAPAAPQAAAPQPAAAAQPTVTTPAEAPSSPVPATTASAPSDGASVAPSPAADAQPVRRPTAGGLSAFAKRKAFELFANSEYEAAAVQLERVVKLAPDVEALEMLLECYLVLERHADAARIGVQLADAEIAAGNRPGAIATLTTLSKKIADPTVEQRRVELMQAKF